MSDQKDKAAEKTVRLPRGCTGNPEFMVTVGYGGMYLVRRVSVTDPKADIRQVMLDIAVNNDAIVDPERHDGRIYLRDADGREYVAGFWETDDVERISPDYLYFSNDQGDDIDPDDEATTIMVEPEESEGDAPAVWIA